jgi:transcription elongation factor GreA
LTKKEIILTPEGYRKLVEELRYLETKRRKEVAERIKQSIEFGDLAENSEYDDAKNEQAFVEGRIMEINELLSRARIIEDDGEKPEAVSLGSYVVLLDIATGEKEEYQIVGSVEADPSNHRISNESPVGKAIMNKKPGEIVRVEVPEGSVEYKIVRIKRPRKRREVLKWQKN